MFTKFPNTENRVENNLLPPKEFFLTNFELFDCGETLSRMLDMYGLLTKWEVKMAGYWPSSFFACLWTERESRSINSQKKERGQYPAILTEQAWSTEGFIIWLSGKFFLRDMAGSPERAR